MRILNIWAQSTKDRIYTYKNVNKPNNYRKKYRNNQANSKQCNPKSRNFKLT